jgi:hypothetical protein
MGATSSNKPSVKKTSISTAAIRKAVIEVIKKDLKSKNPTVQVTVTIKSTTPKTSSAKSKEPKLSSKTKRSASKAKK